MARFIISKKLTIKEAIDAIPQIEQWFKNNPKRKVCLTDIWKVRRGFVGTDVLAHTDLKTLV